MNPEKTREEIAALISHRIEDMKKTDEETGEHPDASDYDYILWALEECETNDGLVLGLTKYCEVKEGGVICGDPVDGVIKIHWHST